MDAQNAILVHMCTMQMLRVTRMEDLGYSECYYRTHVHHAGAESYKDIADLGCSECYSRCSECSECYSLVAPKGGQRSNKETKSKAKLAMLQVVGIERKRWCMKEQHSKGIQSCCFLFF